ncbi:MAG: TetR/AcrR family transcriptional regulator [Bdellovibrionaceae bacterium]|nr:TetR/AcrR family transcriptional regulator [Pseudobdellovibrionaceae bacterium]
MASEERLLSAAKEIFSKLGFHAATTRAIAQKAKVNEALIARYFDGKFGLLLALLQQEAKQGHQEPPSYPPQDSVEKELTEYAFFHFHKIVRESDLFKIILSQFLTDPKFLKRFRESIPLVTQDVFLRDRLRFLQEKGKINANASLEDIIADVKIINIGHLLFTHLIKGDSEEETLKQLQRLIRVYAGNLG